jgi:hypothetical protein
MHIVHITTILHFHGRTRATFWFPAYKWNRLSAVAQHHLALFSGFNVGDPLLQGLDLSHWNPIASLHFSLLNHHSPFGLFEGACVRQALMSKRKGFWHAVHASVFR